MLTLQNANLPHFQHSRAPLSLLFSNPEQEDGQALPQQSRSFIGWLLSALPVSCTISFQNLPPGCFQNTQPHHTCTSLVRLLLPQPCRAHFQLQLQCHFRFKDLPPLDSPHSFLCSSTYPPATSVSPLQLRTPWRQRPWVFLWIPRAQHRAWHIAGIQ